MATIATIRARIRKDLKDDPASRWTDDEIDRHIEHAASDISQAAPYEKKDTALVIATPASREIDISAIAGLIYVEAVEYPTGEYPKRYRDYRVWANKLELLIDETPTAAEPVYLYYGSVHTIDAIECTLPPNLEDLCAVGAGAFAALEWATYAINMLNVGGDPTPKQYLEWANQRLEYYHKELTRYGRQARLKVRQLYAATD